MTSARPLQKLGAQGVWYSLASIAAKAGGFLLLPFITDQVYLPVAALGLWGVLEVSIQIGLNLFSLQIGSGIIQFYNADPVRTRNAAFAGAGILGLLACLVAFFVAKIAGGAFSVSAAWISLWIFAELALMASLALLRARGKAKEWTFISSLKVLIATAWMCVELLSGNGLEGLIRATAGASSATFVISLLYQKSEWRFSIDGVRPVLTPMLLFSAPLVVAGLSSLLLNAGDRYLLLWFSSPEQVGIYGMAARFAGLLNMLLVQPFNLAWHPMLSALKPEEKGPEIQKLYRLIPVASSVLWIGIVAGMAPLFSLMGSDALYFDSILMAALLCGGFYFYSLSIIEIGFLSSVQKSGTVSLAIGLAILMNAVLNVAVIPFWGGMAASATTLAAYLFLWLYLVWMRAKSEFLSISWRSAAGLPLLTGVVSVVLSLLISRNFFTDLVFGAASVLFVALGIAASGALKRSDLEALQTFLFKKPSL